jgi:hypothetical protein
MFQSKVIILFIAVLGLSNIGIASANKTISIHADLVDMVRYHRSGANISLSRGNNTIALSGVDYNVEPNKSCLALLSSAAAIDAADKKIMLYFQYSLRAQGSATSLTGKAGSFDTFSNVELYSCILQNK